ncbi:hypothetical protein ACFXHA_00335 [Nocardia sp. NPDC059240]|uniref:hypothetical protein n=1 Tax=Nocardia sp. NPDC059240 TaxID=3346786 RepID=UPI0036870EDA
MTINEQHLDRRAQRRNTTFVLCWLMVGLLVTLFTALVSFSTMASYEDFLYGGSDWDRFTTAASKSEPAQACLWVSWLVAGVTCWYLGGRAIERDRNPLWAFVIAVIVFEIGLDVTFEIAMRGIDAAYRS